jgi:RpiR family carbohydrate utilization transcriptional regulator
MTFASLHNSNPSAVAHKPSVVDRMRHALRALSKAEQRVAGVVLSDINAATRMSTRELARRALVSEPTIVRFARHMGTNGFPDFKMRLSEDLATARMFVFPEYTSLPRDSASVANQVYEATAQALAYSFAQRDPVALESAATAIHQARRLFCMGVGGSSAIVAQEAANRLFRFDIHVSAIVDSYQQLMAAALCDAKDVLLLFSVTGRPQSLVDSANIARELGAAVISVTRMQSPVADASTILIPLDVPDHEHHFQIPNRSRYGQLYIVDCLATLVGTRRLKQSAPKLSQMRGILAALHGEADQQPVGD